MCSGVKLSRSWNEAKTLLVHGRATVLGTCRPFPLDCQSGFHGRWGADAELLLGKKAFARFGRILQPQQLLRPPVRVALHSRWFDDDNHRMCCCSTFASELQAIVFAHLRRHGGCHLGAIATCGSCVRCRQSPQTLERALVPFAPQLRPLPLRGTVQGALASLFFGRCRGNWQAVAVLHHSKLTGNAHLVRSGSRLGRRTARSRWHR